MNILADSMPTASRMPDVLAWRPSTIHYRVLRGTRSPGNEADRQLQLQGNDDRPLGSSGGAESATRDTSLQQGLDVGPYAPSDFHTMSFADLADYAREFRRRSMRRSAAHRRATRPARRQFFCRSRPDWLGGGTAREHRRPARAAGAGEAIAVAQDATVVAQVTFQVPPTAWRPGPNHIDLVELIGIDQTGAKILAQGAPETSGAALTHTLRVPSGGLVLRARGFRILETGTRLAFYTNPVRIVVNR